MALYDMSQMRTPSFSFILFGGRGLMRDWHMAWLLALILFFYGKFFPKNFTFFLLRLSLTPAPFRNSGGIQNGLGKLLGIIFKWFLWFWIGVGAAFLGFLGNSPSLLCLLRAFWNEVLREGIDCASAPKAQWWAILTLRYLVPRRAKRARRF